MQYHALSLSQQVSEVSMIGLTGEEVLGSLTSNPHFKDVRIRPSLANKLPRSLFLVAAPLKVVHQVVRLSVALFSAKHLDLVILQNPPVLPALLVVFLWGEITGGHVVLDWHNTGFSMVLDRCEGVDSYTWDVL